MANNNTTTSSGRIMKRKETDAALLADATKLLQNIAEALNETSRGEDSFTVICRRRNLDSRKVQQLLQTSTFRNCSLSDTIVLKDLGEKDILLPEAYERFYRKVFDKTDFAGLSLPEDYKETAEYVIRTFDQRERKILSCRLGREGKSCEPMSLWQTAALLNLSVERIREIEKGAYRKARSGLNFIILRMGLSAYREQKNEEAQLLRIERQEEQKKPGEHVRMGEMSIREEYLNTPLVNTELSRRTCLPLMRTGIKTIGDLLQYDPYLLPKVRQIGSYRYNELQLFIGQVNAYLGQEFPKDL
ncbi:MAG: hypothetical protein LUG93_16915 [Lachnospiraceae bacterium]|nr:hypothetical protein [Lachnospiraceae bacterium]